MKGYIYVGTREAYASPTYILKTTTDIYIEMLIYEKASIPGDELEFILVWELDFPEDKSKEEIEILLAQHEENMYKKFKKYRMYRENGMETKWFKYEKFPEEVTRYISENIKAERVYDISRLLSPPEGFSSSDIFDAME